MGTFLTSYGDAGYDHEGYADRLMPTGEYSGGEYSARYPRDAHAAFVAACGCGWRGSTAHPPSDAGEDLALHEWEHTHARPVLQRVAHRELVEVQRRLRSLASLAAGLTETASRRELAEQLDHHERLLTNLTDRVRRLAVQAHEQTRQQDARQRPQ